MKKSLKISIQNIFFCIAAAKIILLCSGCNSASSASAFQPSTTFQYASNIENNVASIVNPIDILDRPQVPILCYHQIRDWTSSDSKRARDYIVPLNNFRDQVKLLADNGYHTILPDQLYSYLLKGSPLPTNPIMISFDDSRLEQFTIAHEEMNKYGFKGTFFIMTVSLGRPGYMSKEQVKQLADEGNTIGSHTWDHSNVKNYLTEDWVKQVDKPCQQLEKITGKPVEYFAYPFGLWDKKGIEQLKQRHFKAAFQLSAKRDESNAQYTIRRIIVPGEWNAATLQKWINHSF